MVSEISFGHINGKECKLFRITDPDGSYVELIDLGAAVRSIVLKTEKGPVDVALGYDTAEEYYHCASCAGKTIGRFANRIAGASFVLYGTRYELDRNDGPNCIHGGNEGLADKDWDHSITDNSVTFRCKSPDLEGGFPGEISVTVTYTFEKGTLSIDYRAVTTKACPVNLTNHTYFNLAGHKSGNVMDQELCISADSVLITDEHLIPIEEVMLSDHPELDIREWKGEKEEDRDLHLDNNYCLRGSGFRKAASAFSNVTGIGMEVWTDTPGVQVYNSWNLPSHKGKDGATYGPNTGIAFETQYYPDSPNRPDFPDTVLKPGEELVSRTEYRFDIR